MTFPNVHGILYFDLSAESLFAVFEKRRNNMNATDSDDCSDDERTTPYCILLAIRYRRILC